MAARGAAQRAPTAAPFSLAALVPGAARAGRAAAARDDASVRTDGSKAWAGLAPFSSAEAAADMLDAASGGRLRAPGPACARAGAPPTMEQVLLGRRGTLVRAAGQPTWRRTDARQGRPSPRATSAAS